MQLVGILKLDAFKRAHADCRGPLEAWQPEVEAARWSGPQNVKDRYPSAGFLADNRVIFNIKGNPYRLVVKARYTKAGPGSWMSMRFWFGALAS